MTLPQNILNIIGKIEIIRNNPELNHKEFNEQLDITLNKTEYQKLFKRFPELKETFNELKFKE